MGCENSRLSSQWIGDFGYHNGLWPVQERKRGLLLERTREEEAEKQRFQRCDEEKRCLDEGARIDECGPKK